MRIALRRDLNLFSDLLRVVRAENRRNIVLEVAGLNPALVAKPVLGHPPWRSCPAQPPRGGDSHYRISYPGKPEKLTIPFKRPIKPVYIKKLVAFLRGIES